MFKQGTVTLDVNDYDKLREKELKLAYVIDQEDDKLTVLLPVLTEALKIEILSKYPDYIIDYWGTNLSLNFTKKKIESQEASNE